MGCTGEDTCATGLSLFLREPQAYSRLCFVFGKSLGAPFIHRNLVPKLLLPKSLFSAIFGGAAVPGRPYSQNSPDCNPRNPVLQQQFSGTAGHSKEYVPEPTRAD